MYSPSANNTTWAPPQTEDQRAEDPALNRLRDLFGVDLVCITRLTGGGLHLVAAAGVRSLLGELADLPVHRGPDHAISVTADLAAGQLSTRQLRFHACIPLTSSKTDAPLFLVLCDRRPRSAAMAHRLAALAIELTSRATVDRQAKQLAKVEAYLEYRRDQFERASRTARIGIWECDLADERLSWTDGIYDLFDLPRGSKIDRQQTLTFYTDASRAEMLAARSKAIADCTEFSVDAEIVTAKGVRRWMRLTGAVEVKDGVAFRIFGMKQDITEEKLLADQTRYLAEYDVMTGLANRSQFQSRLNDLDGVQYGQAIGGLLLIDLDGFKQVNDTHGHALGDECLKEAARRLQECCQGAALVARIGGDEFAALLGVGYSVPAAQAMASTIVAMIGRPLVRDGKTISMGASVGIAHNRGETPEHLFRHADAALYAAKAAGRNTSRVFMAAQNSSSAA